MTKKKNPVNPKIERIVILKAARSALDQSTQWLAHPESHDWVSNALKYIAQAEILIKLLEEDDCGSVGGFDTCRGQDNDKMRTLKDRLKWLEKIS